ncbi:hypothetical protein Ancab_029968 [Ancistrocladus abbreviatus]
MAPVVKLLGRTFYYEIFVPITTVVTDVGYGNRVVRFTNIEDCNHAFLSGPWVRALDFSTPYYEETIIKIFGNLIERMLKIDTAKSIALQGNFVCFCVDINLGHKKDSCPQKATEAPGGSNEPEADDHVIPFTQVTRSEVVIDTVTGHAAIASSRMQNGKHSGEEALEHCLVSLFQRVASLVGTLQAQPKLIEANIGWESPLSGW